MGTLMTRLGPVGSSVALLYGSRVKKRRFTPRLKNGYASCQFGGLGTNPQFLSPLTETMPTVLGPSKPPLCQATHRPSGDMPKPSAPLAIWRTRRVLTSIVLTEKSVSKTIRWGEAQ